MTQEQKQTIQLTTHELLMSEGIEKRIDQLTAEMIKPDSEVVPIDATQALVVAVSRALSHIKDQEVSAIITQLVIEAAASHDVSRYINEVLRGQSEEQDKLIRKLSDQITELEASDHLIEAAFTNEPTELLGEIEEAQIKPSEFNVDAIEEEQE